MHWTDLIESARDTARYSPEHCTAGAAGYTIDSMVESYLAVYERIAKEA